MYPGRFDYHAPATLEEALALLDRHREDAKVLAGGQSLVPMMKLRFASPAVLVDINGVAGLDYIQAEQHNGASELRVGALARHRQLERAMVLSQRFPAMAAAAPQISDPVVRNRGTLVGSLCHADPQGDWASVMLAMNAEVVARSVAGERRIPVRDFVVGPFTTALEPNELAVEVRVPDTADHVFGTYLKLERKIGDFATVGAAVHLAFSNGEVSQAGIGLTAVAPHNLKAEAAEQALAGRPLDEDSIKAAAAAAAAAASPQGDIRGSADYKRHVVGVFVARALRQAAAAAA